MDFDGIAAAFATFGEPFGQGQRQPRGSDAKSRFELAFGQGECVIKFGGTGKIAHAKRVQPVERAGAPLAGDNHFDEKSLRIHSGYLRVFPKIPRQYNIGLAVERRQDGRRNSLRITKERG